jgi:hypothetical protein
MGSVGLSASRRPDPCFRRALRAPARKSLPLCRENSYKDECSSLARVRRLPAEARAFNVTNGMRHCKAASEASQFALFTTICTMDLRIAR